MNAKCEISFVGNEKWTDVVMDKYTCEDAETREKVGADKLHACDLTGVVREGCERSVLDK